jgi:hypothetical protein
MAETKTGGQRRTGSSKSANKRTSTKKPSSASKSNGAQEAEDRTEATGDQESALTRIASQAKAPAMAGAAAAGLFGAIAIARHGRRGGISLPGVGKKRRRMALPSVSVPKLPKPHAPQLKGDGKATRKALGATARAVGSAAAEVGKAGYRVGELTAEIRQVREQARQDQDRG